MTPSEVAQWLEGDDPGAALRPAKDEALVVHPASPRLNRAEHDDPDLLDPDDPRAVRQMSLSEQGRLASWDG